MKPTLNEEIGMSKNYFESVSPRNNIKKESIDQQKGIDYVTSLEVKKSELQRQFSERNTSVMDLSTYSKSISNNIPEEIETQRIKRQGRNALICVLIIIALTFITNYFNK